MWKSSRTRPEDQPSKRLRERNGLNVSRFKLFRRISYFWSRRLPGGMGVFHAKGSGSKSSFPHSKVLFSLGFEGGNLGCSRNFARMSRSPGGLKKNLKKAVAVSEEKFQELSRRRGRFSSRHFPSRNLAKPWQG